MRYIKITGILLFAVMFAMTGCIKKEVMVAPPIAVPAEVKPPEPSLAEQLDTLYKTDLSKWREKMGQLIEDENPKLPTKHLRYGIKLFNETKTRKTCIDASYLYMKKRYVETNGLSGTDEQMFSEFAEFALTDGDPHVLSRLESLCRVMKNDICTELNR